MNNNKGLMLSILGVLSIVLITTGITYAFFTYTGTGTTDNVITTDTITFLYTEVDGIGNGIQIENAFPTSDEKGKVLTKTNEYFDFKVTSKTATMYAIPYEVTARKSSDSTDIDKYIRVYLTKGETNEEVLLDDYSELPQTSKVDSSKYTEKTIYKGEVPEGSINYEESFRLRMWLSDEARFDTMDMNNKTFKLTVNVYANARVVTEEEIAYESSTKINVLSVNDTELTTIEDENYDYEAILPKDTTSATINIETENSKATVSVEKIDSLAKSNNVKRLAVTKNLELTNGDNYFKVIVTSENKKETAEYKLKISVPIELTAAIYNKYPVAENKATLDKTSLEANENGLYKSTLTNSGDPTYYFRGNVDNTVEFAGFVWKVIRINEDGTIRIIMQDGVNDNADYNLNPTRSGYEHMYYSNSNVENGAKYILDDWYQTNILETGYSIHIVTGDYFCEEARVKLSSDYTSEKAAMNIYNETYEPTFSCNEDGNEKGIVNASIGLITYDEALHAGAYYNKDNSEYYLYNGTSFWTMSPAGIDTNNYALDWRISPTGFLRNTGITLAYALRPVINLKADTPVVEGENTVWKVVN